MLVASAFKKLYPLGNSKHWRSKQSHVEESWGTQDTVSSLYEGPWALEAVYREEADVT